MASMASRAHSGEGLLSCREPNSGQESASQVVIKVCQNSLSLRHANNRPSWHTFSDARKLSPKNVGSELLRRIWRKTVPSCVN